jgi:tetratricopeptide (TPR) repeat protein
MTGLALLYRGQERYDDAERLLLQVLKIEEQQHSEDHAEVLRTKNNIAHIYELQERYEDAAPLYYEVLEKRKSVLGINHPETIGHLYNMADFELRRGNPSAAMERLRESVEAGFSDVEWILADTNLSALHGPEFDILVEQVRDNAAASAAARED